MNDTPRYRFLLVQAFNLPPDSKYQLRPMQGSKETMLMNHAEFAPLLADVAWDLHPGARAPHGDWPVETPEEFCLVAASRLPIVREASQGGKYDAVVLLGGGDPGYRESVEIGRRHGIAVTSCAHAQMQVATMLGNKFTIVDVSECHNMQMHQLVVQYRMVERCASIRNVNFPLPRPPRFDQPSILEQKRKADRGERSEMLEAAVAESVAAIEEDGAEVIILGCSAAYWLKWPLEKRLREIGWEVPVLEGYGCAIAQAKLLVSLGLDASGLAYPGDASKKWRRKKVF